MQDKSDNSLFTVDRNINDPAGTGLRGMAPGYDLTRGATGHPQLLWVRKNGGDIFLEADVYVTPGQPALTLLYINCPICMAHGRVVQLCIRQGQKSIDYQPDRRPPNFPGWNTERMVGEIGEIWNSLGRVPSPSLGGTLTIEEPIRCTFEADPTKRTLVDPLCPWKVRITKNVVKDA